MENRYDMLAVHLTRVIDRAQPLLLEMDVSTDPEPGLKESWSRKEELGHLIDSALNNHQRFVRAQLQDELIFPGYEQDAWVSVQAYQQAPWVELVHLWAALNRHLSHLVEQIPDTVLIRPVTKHNFHEIAWKPMTQEDVVTLAWFVDDYTGHLVHHLEQILQRPGSFFLHESGSSDGFGFCRRTKLPMTIPSCFVPENVSTWTGPGPMNGRDGPGAGPVPELKGGSPIRS